MSRLRRLVRNLKINRSHKPVRTRLGIESLERREVPAIALINNTLTVNGDASNDAITISIDNNNTATIADDMVVVSRIATTTGGPLGGTFFSEQKSFALLQVGRIQSSLGAGNNSFVNNTSFKCTVTGGAGQDDITGGGNADVIYGGGGNDFIRGQGGDDTIFGGTGDDHLAGGTGTDKIYGDAGNDRIFGEALEGSSSAADGENVLHGGAGNDTICGAAGCDSIYGDDGDDQLVGGDGNDLLDGGNGNDKLMGNDGDDKLFGGVGNDDLMGNDGNDTLCGGAGNDTLRGDDGDDSLLGGDGDDRLLGLDGNDVLRGQSGKDYLIGGKGGDQMYGGFGRDVLVALDGSADIVCGGNTAFNFEHDEFWLDNVDAVANPVTLSYANYVDKHALHVVNSYKSYVVNGDEVSVSLSLGNGNLVDPSSDPENGLPAKANFHSNKLFASTGPTWTDIDQGSNGDCYFLARLASMAKAYPQYIRDMISDLGDGTYAVQFWNEDGSRSYVRVDADLYVNSNSKPIYADLGNEGSLWVAVVEKAWAVFRDTNAGYAEISGGNGPISTDVALGLDDTAFHSDDYATGLAYVRAIKGQLAAGRAIHIGSQAGMTDDMPMIPENYHRGAHIYMVESVVCNAQGTPTALKLYNLYGGGLTTITNFEMLKYCSGSFGATKPK